MAVNGVFYIFCFYFWLCYRINWSYILSHNVFMFCNRKCVKVWTMWFLFSISLLWLYFIVFERLKIIRILMLVINLSSSYSCLFLNFVTKPVRIIRVGALIVQKVIWVWRFDSVAKKKKQGKSHMTGMFSDLCLSLSVSHPAVGIWGISQLTVLRVSRQTPMAIPQCLTLPTRSLETWWW